MSQLPLKSITFYKLDKPFHKWPMEVKQKKGKRKSLLRKLFSDQAKKFFWNQSTGELLLCITSPKNTSKNLNNWHHEKKALKRFDFGRIIVLKYTFKVKIIVRETLLVIRIVWTDLSLKLKSQTMNLLL